MPEPHTPKAHAKHTDPSIPCGCWTGEQKKVISCRWCGASYDLTEVLSFTHWTCYDCGSSVYPRK